MTLRTTIAIAALALNAGQVDAADVSSLSDDSVIMISADESWEDPDQDVIYFRGNFEIRTPHWTLTADLATVFGKLEDPQRIVADGSPVQFTYRHEDSGKSSVTEGEGQHLEYERERELLILSGDAKLATEGRTMHSSKIRYDLEQEKLEAGGSEGVQITIEPDSLDALKDSPKKQP